MRSLTLALLTVASTIVSGQWSVGGLGHFSLSERGRQAEYGASARITRNHGHRSSIFCEVGMNVPRTEQWDNSFGARGLLSVGIAPFTRHEGQQVHFQEELCTGNTWRIGRRRNKDGDPHFYCGAMVGLVHRALRYQSLVTNLIDGTQETYKGSNDHFGLRIGPLLGYRSREGRGRICAEALPSIVRDSQESTAWNLRTCIALGYLWRIRP